METKRAIDILKCFQDPEAWEKQITEEAFNALQMAIDVLSDEGDTISRQAAISAICSACGKIDCDKMDKCEKLQLPPANCSEIPNSSDTISRAKAIEVCDGYMKKLCSYISTPNDTESLSYARGLLVGVINNIKQLPPAQPEPSQVAKDIARIVGNEQDMRVIGQERIRGHWIPVGGALYQCDQCGVVSLKRKFCSECGADMREVTE